MYLRHLLPRIGRLAVASVCGHCEEAGASVRVDVTVTIIFGERLLRAPDDRGACVVKFFADAIFSAPALLFDAGLVFESRAPLAQGVNGVSQACIAVERGAHRETFHSNAQP